MVDTFQVIQTLVLILLGVVELNEGAKAIKSRTEARSLYDSIQVFRVKTGK